MKKTIVLLLSIIVTGCHGQNATTAYQMKITEVDNKKESNNKYETALLK